MARTDNYKIQADSAKARFLAYDQEQLIRKLSLRADATYLYTTFFGYPYRLNRRNGDVEFFGEGIWQDGNSFAEVMTLLDMICDSSPSRFVSGRWKNMTAFGLMFHQNLLEGKRDPWAEKFSADPDRFRRACVALGGKPMAVGDIAYALEVFDGLPIAVQLWFGDEEFPANLRIMWDENALQYLRYETMHFARGLLLNRLALEMDR